MNIEQLREYCLSKKATTECFPFDATTLVFKVAGKMFAVTSLDRPDCVSMKCNPEYALELRERYQAIEGAYHFNKKYWNQIHFNKDVDDTLLLQLIDHSYDEVLKTFTKKQRTAYDETI